MRQGKSVFAKSFGESQSPNDIFLLASISKPMSATALMTLYDQGKLRLTDTVKKFIPEFTGAGRNKITVRQLLTHVSGLPDQLPENQSLRKRHAELVKGKSILLIDDVITTGATAEACVRALLLGGAAGVDVLTLARTLDRST